MANKKEIPKRWFKSMDIFHSKKYIPNVLNDIEHRSDIQEKIKGFKDAFIKFAALERVNYEPDIDDELECYLRKKRIYEINVKEWYRIRKVVFDRDNYTCQYCGKRGCMLEVDHVIPFSKGGSYELSNLVTACRKCNRQKRDKSLEEFNEWKQKHEKLLSTR